MGLACIQFRIMEANRREYWLGKHSALGEIRTQWQEVVVQLKRGGRLLLDRFVREVQKFCHEFIQSRPETVVKKVFADKSPSSLKVNSHG